MSTGTDLDVVMPQMGVSVSEGTVTRWLRGVGDTVASDESLLEISTDKVDTEVPSPGSGVLREILVFEGETVSVGTVLARIDGAVQPEPAALRREPEPPAVSAAPPPPSEEADLSDRLSPEPVAVQGEQHDLSDRPSSEPTPVSAAEPGSTGHTFISPVVARISAEHGIDPATLEGSGRAGRVTKKDVLAFVETLSQTAEPSVAAPVAAPIATAVAATEPIDAPGAAAAAPPPAPPAAVGPHAPGSGLPPEVAGTELAPGESLEPMSIMRRGIAEHMRRSLDTAAHVTSAIEVDMSKVAAIRERIKSEFVASYGVNPTYLAFIARAAVDTLRDWPWVNAELRGESILTRSHVNLGFAVSLEGGKGLIVPVLKHAEGLNLLGMARGIADLAERARTRKLLPDDVQGGTFTITNPGSFGTLLGTPIISQPQSAILGTYAIVKRPWVISDDEGQDAIAIRSIMNLTLTYDHRLVDGAYGAQFLRDLAGRLQTWGEADY